MADPGVIVSEGSAMRLRHLACLSPLLLIAAPPAVARDCIPGITAEKCPENDIIGEIEPPFELLSPRRDRAQDDLIVGATNKVTTVGRVGAAYVFRGQASGSPLAPDQELTKPAEDAASRDFFGSAAALADFDGDGFEDAVVGVLGGHVAGASDRPGEVALFMGAHEGFSFERYIRKPFGNGGLPGGFGAALAIGDFDGDGAPDLAVGSPGHPVGDDVPGSTFVYFNRLAADFPFPFTPPFGLRLNDPSVHFDDENGWSLAAGDFDGDGDDELFVGVSGRRRAGVPHVGAVRVWSHTGDGIAMEMVREIGFSSAETPPLARRFGHSMALADFDLDGRLDIAVGAPGISPIFNFDDPVPDGQVHIFMNDEDSLTEVAVLTQEGLSETHPNEFFGFALAAGDFNGDGYPDLAVSAPHNLTPPPPPSLSARDALFAGFRFTGRLSRDKDLREKLGRRDPLSIVDDCFGLGPRPLPGGRGGRAGFIPDPDTVIPLDDCGPFLEIGGVKPPRKIRQAKRTGRVFLFINNEGVLEPFGPLGAGAPHPEQGQALIGYSLASGDYNGDGFADLVAGALQRDATGGVPQAGSAEVWLGGPDGLVFAQTLDAGALSNPPLTAQDEPEQFGHALSP